MTRNKGIQYGALYELVILDEYEINSDLYLYTAKRLDEVDNIDADVYGLLLSIRWKVQNRISVRFSEVSKLTTWDSFTIRTIDALVYNRIPVVFIHGSTEIDLFIEEFPKQSNPIGKHTALLTSSEITEEYRRAEDDPNIVAKVKRIVKHYKRLLQLY